MQRLLIIISLLFCLQASSQQAFLFVKKKAKKVRIYPEGSLISFCSDGVIFSGYITRLRNDTVFVNGEPFASGQVERIMLPKRKSGLTAKNLLYTSGAVVLSTVGMKASGWETFEGALISSSVIGYTPWAMAAIKKLLTRKGYKLGKKFRLQVFDLRPY